MNTSIQTLRNEEQGFTLVELAVVMIIIGILIGGILKGQELITNARVTSTIDQTEALAGAYNGFRDKYSALPGDMNNATTRIPNCGAGGIIACVNGNGDGDLEVGVGAAQGSAAANESVNFFGQLLAADFITGMDGTVTAPTSFGTTNPTAPIGGGFKVGDRRIGQTGFTDITRPGPYVVLSNSTAAAAATTGVLSASQAAQLDRRLDDGVPHTGSVIGIRAATSCVAAAADVIYDEDGDTACEVAYRL